MTSRRSATLAAVASFTFGAALSIYSEGAVNENTDTMSSWLFPALFLGLPLLLAVLSLLWARIQGEMVGYAIAPCAVIGGWAVGFASAQMAFESAPLGKAVGGAVIVGTFAFVFYVMTAGLLEGLRDARVRRRSAS